MTGAPSLSQLYSTKNAAMKTAAAELLTGDLEAIATLGYAADLPKGKLYGKNLKIRQVEGQSSDDNAIKLKGLVLGVRAVASYSRDLLDSLPDFTVVFAPGQISSRKILNAAHHVSATRPQGDPEYTLFLTSSSLELALPKTTPFVDSPRLEMGPSGARGVPDMIADQDEHKLAPKVGRVAGIVIHEIGHMLHSCLKPTEFWALIHGGDVETKWKVTAKHKEQVSMYSAGNSSLNEYVAEVFTMLVNGERSKLTTAAYEDYVACGGPPTPS